MGYENQIYPYEFIQKSDFTQNIVGYILSVIIISNFYMIYQSLIKSKNEYNLDKIKEKKRLSLDNKNEIEMKGNDVNNKGKEKFVDFKSDKEINLIDNDNKINNLEHNTEKNKDNNNDNEDNNYKIKNVNEKEKDNSNTETNSGINTYIINENIINTKL